MSAQFLPKDYISPRLNGSYTKLANGVNKIRILSSPIVGWEDWIDQKPVRFRMDAKPKSWHDIEKPGRHFWSMIIWNYQDEVIQVLHLTQGSIRKAIEALSNDSDWGPPFFYDIKITREGEGLKTKYTVNPLPHKDLDSNIKDMFKASPCYLDALYYGQDPFGTWDTYTEGVFTKEDSNSTGKPDSSKFTSKIKSYDESHTQCTQEEVDDFINAWSLSFGEDVVRAYIEKRSKHFDVDPKETVSLLMNNQEEFEKELKVWAAKQQKAKK